MEVQSLAPRTERAEPRSVVFYGSSSIRLWSSLQADIAPLTGHTPRQIINLGFGGSTLAACVHFFDLLPGRIVREQGPLRSLVFYAGENDLGDGKSVEAVVDSFFWLHAMVRDRLGETPFAFLSIKPSPARVAVRERIRAVNSQIRDQIASRPQSLYIDLYAEMVHPDGTPRTELWAEDGIHLSPAGYALWTRVLAQYQEVLFQ